MVANLSAHKRGWDERWEEFSQWADRGQDIVRRALHLVDEDTEAFNRIMDAFGLPKGTEEEKAARSQAIQDATLYATKVPLETMKTAYAAFDICRAMAQEGNPASVSDAGVGALAARSAVLGASTLLLSRTVPLPTPSWPRPRRWPRTHSSRRRRSSLSSIRRSRDKTPYRSPLAERRQRAFTIEQKVTK